MRTHIPTAMAAALVLLQPASFALTPLTPRLTSESQLELLTKLTQLGFPEVGQNSVLTAITGALGFEPRPNSYTSELPYAHLPKVSAQSTPGPKGCADVMLLARYETPPMRVRLQGRYCLVGPANWRADRQEFYREEP